MEKNVKLMKRSSLLWNRFRNQYCVSFLINVYYIWRTQRSGAIIVKKSEQIHIMTLSYYSNKSIFFKADCVRSKHEKHSQDSRENCRVRTIWICQGKYNSTYLTTTFIHFDYKILKYVWTTGFSFAWKIKSMVFLTFCSSCH